MRALRVIKQAAQDKVRLKAERRGRRANLPSGLLRALGPARSSPPTSSNRIGVQLYGTIKKVLEGKIQGPAVSAGRERMGQSRKIRRTARTKTTPTTLCVLECGSPLPLFDPSIPQTNLTRGQRSPRVEKRPRFFEEIIVAAHIRRDLPSVDMKNFGREFADKMNVVRNKHECPVVPLQRQRQ